MKLTLMLAILGFLLPSTLTQSRNLTEEWKFQDFGITITSPTTVSLTHHQPVFECKYKANTSSPYSVKMLRTKENVTEVLDFSWHKGKKLKIYSDYFPPFTFAHKETRNYNRKRNRPGRKRIAFKRSDFIDGRKLICLIEQNEKVVAIEARPVQFYRYPRTVEIAHTHTENMNDAWTSGRNERTDRIVWCVVYGVYPIPKRLEIVSQKNGRVLATKDKNDVYTHDEQYPKNSTYYVVNQFKYAIDYSNYNDAVRCRVVMGADIRNPATITSKNVLGPFDIPEGFNDLQYAGPTMLEIGSEVKLNVTFIPNPKYTIRWSTNEVTGYNLNSIKRLALISASRNHTHQSTHRRYLIERTETSPSFEGRFDVEESILPRGITTFTIFDVKITDERVFICELLEDGHVVYTKNIYISVFKKPDHVYLHSRDMFSPSRNVTTKRITCTAYGAYPSPSDVRLVSTKTGREVESYKYYEREIESQNGTFEVEYSFHFPLGERHHRDCYECHVIIGYNSHKKVIATSENTTGIIYVNEPTTWANLTISRKSTWDTNFVTFTCESNGFPINKLEIRKVGTDGDEFPGLIVKSDDIFTKKIQRNMRVTNAFNGTYVCLTNDIQSDSQDLKVFRDKEDWWYYGDY